MLSRAGTALVLLIALMVVVTGVPIPVQAAPDPDSAALTEYLHNHKLPAVGAQITVGEDGARTVMLYGFVATQRGYENAEKRTRSFLNDPYVRIVNRIKIEPELLALGKSGSQAATSGDTGQSAGNAPPAVADNTPPPANVGDLQQYQAQNQTYDPYAMAGQGTSISGSSLLIPLVGGLLLYGAMGGFSSPSYSPPPTYYYPQPAPRPYYPPPRPRHHHRGGLSPNLFTPAPAPLYTPHVATVAPPVYHYTPPVYHYTPPVYHYTPPVYHYTPPVYHYTPPPVIHYAAPPTFRYSAPPAFSAPPTFQHWNGGGGYHSSFGAGHR
jgi:hypothetical protein